MMTTSLIKNKDLEGRPLNCAPEDSRACELRWSLCRPLVAAMGQRAGVWLPCFWWTWNGARVTRPAVFSHFRYSRVQFWVLQTQKEAESLNLWLTERRERLRALRALRAGKVRAWPANNTNQTNTSFTHVWYELTSALSAQPYCCLWRRCSIPRHHRILCLLLCARASNITITKTVGNVKYSVHLSGGKTFGWFWTFGRVQELLTSKTCWSSSGLLQKDSVRNCEMNIVSLLWGVACVQKALFFSSVL